VASANAAKNRADIPIGEINHDCMFQGRFSDNTSNSGAEISTFQTSKKRFKMLCHHQIPFL
jgi:hypothetical protein